MRLVLCVALHMSFERICTRLRLALGFAVGPLAGDLLFRGRGRLRYVRVLDVDD